MQSLTSFLVRKTPRGLAYDDAAQLCLRLYSVADPGIPSFSNPLTKEYLADTFAGLSKRGWVRGPCLTTALYGANFHEITDKGHWIEVIASLFKRGKDVMNLDRGTELIRMAALDQEAPAP